MAKDSLKINLSGRKSLITYLEGKPDLNSIFKPGDEKQKQKRFFITDGTIATLECMQDFLSKFDDDKCGNDILLVLGSGEPYKTLDSVLKIIEKASDNSFTRNDIFVGIGGGVICDITGFAASIYKRGIQLQLVPTTLLAMVDEAVGGKTSCDFDGNKNIIGTFYPAEKIYYWPDFIDTLPTNHFSSGLAEAFKTALLCDPELYELLKTQSEAILAKDKNLLLQIIHKCVKAKAELIQKDPDEKGVRELLSLGHTFGYALETLSGRNAYTHGEAVAWGISRIVTLSFKKDYCREAFMNEVITALALYGWETNPVPANIPGGGIEERFLAEMHKDKKNMTDKVHLVILKAAGEAVLEDVEDSDISQVLK